MANIFSDHTFTLQWHCTARCQQECAHCYMYDEPTYNEEINHELSTEDCKQIINNFVAFTESISINGRISFTGGDPLVRKDIFELASYATGKGITIGILGNPFLLTDDTIQKMQSSGIDRYQLSLDGLKSTHDRLRAEGSFESTVNAINLLKSNGISVGVMMTLSKENISELLQLMEFVGSIDVDAFAFARISAVGSGKQYHSLPIDPFEYRKLLIRVEEKSAELKKEGVKTRYRKKCHLWKLLDFERGNLVMPDDKETIFGGCTLGVTGLIILADGTVMGCRRFPSVVGKLPGQDLFDIFTSSDKLERYRDYSLLEKCSKCELVQVCRGCQAVAYGHHGRRTAPDPQCWK